MQKLCRGQRRHGNRVMGRRRRYSQCALKHIAERPRQAVQCVDVGERQNAGNRPTLISPRYAAEALHLRLPQSGPVESAP
jgi:hypothetical protein